MHHGRKVEVIERIVKTFEAKSVVVCYILVFFQIDKLVNLPDLFAQGDFLEIDALMLNLDFVIFLAEIRSNIGQPVNDFLDLILGVPELVHGYPGASFVPNGGNVVMSKGEFEVAVEILTGGSLLGFVLKPTDVKEFKNLLDVIFLHDFVEVVLEELRVFLLVDFEDVFEHQIIRLGSINFQRPHDLGLEIEISAYDQIVFNAQLGLLLDGLRKRIILRNHVKQRALDLPDFHLVRIIRS